MMLIILIGLLVNMIFSLFALRYDSYIIHKDLWIYLEKQNLNMVGKMIPCILITPFTILHYLVGLLLVTSSISARLIVKSYKFLFTKRK